MSIFFQLPMDLRERWWSAITLDEREEVEREFEASKQPAPVEPVEKLTIRQMIADYASSDYYDPKAYVFVLFLQECYTQEQRDEVMKGLLNCECCSHHQHKELRHKSCGDVTVKGCKCNCRHYARLFKRNNLA